MSDCNMCGQPVLPAAVWDQSSFLHLTRIELVVQVKAWWCRERGLASFCRDWTPTTNMACDSPVSSITQPSCTVLHSLASLQRVVLPISDEF